MTDLTELEDVALGVVWRDGPCTPYHVRKQFLASPTPSWSGSAGTVYPLMRRLEGLGLLASRDADRDRRSTRLYRVTATGRRELKRWLRPPLAPAVVGPGVDPVRTRLLFVGVLSDSERRNFLDVVHGQLEEVVTEMRALERVVRKDGNPLHVLAARGALGVARARRKWFKEVLAELS